MKNKKIFCKEWMRHDTITELLEKACDQYDSNILFQWKENDVLRQITYQQWKADIIRVSKAVDKFDSMHIGLLCENTYECYLCLYAVMVSGKVVVPIEANQSVENLEKYLKQADVKVLLYSKETLEVKPADCICMEMKAVANCAEQISGQFQGVWPIWEKTRPACIVFTSGTGGEKACVLLSQQNIASINALSSAGKVFSLGSKTVMFLPLYHAFAVSIATVCIDSGCVMYLNAGVRYLQKEIQEVHPDFLVTVPMVNEMFRRTINKAIDSSGKRRLFDMMVKASGILRKVRIDLRRKLFREVHQGLGGRLSVIISGGAAVPKDMIEFFDEIGICLLQGYGMTESTCAITMNTVTANRFGSVGVVFPFNEVRILDEEVQICGKNVMLGYYRNEKENVRVFDGKWMKTGDKGRFDKDGFLYITGRIKNLILLSNGENVSPEELEFELLKSPYIQEVLVMEKNQHIHAEIFPNKEMEENSDKIYGFIEDAIREFNQKNAVYKRIVSWNLREDPFEKTATLKIRRGKYV